MTKLLLAIILAGASYCSPASATPVQVEFSAHSGRFRIQRIETSFVLSDALGGFFGDALDITPGDYRIQLIPDVPSDYQVLFFDIKVDTNGTIVKLDSKARFTSVIWADKRLPLARAPISINSKARGFVISIQEPAKGDIAVQRVSAPIRATNWSLKLEESRGLPVTINTVPQNAEIWVNEQKYPLSTNARFTIPVNPANLFGSPTVLLRKRGFVNSLITIDTEGETADYTVELEKAP
ncbi:hypothetical protein [Rhizobium sp. Rhizsp82]|uniref:hypothetical protein n=1 Tax=Rhizobium sp. Rhizsp82 TaxID=3243057 RepID=UPI0039B592D9